LFFFFPSSFLEPVLFNPRHPETWGEKGRMAASSAVYAGVSQTCARSISMVQMFETAFSMIPSATAIFARPIARAAPLQLAAVGFGCCGAATLGMTGALDMQDPCQYHTLTIAPGANYCGIQFTDADILATMILSAVMWGRHDRRTRKGKIHVGNTPLSHTDVA